ncbi:L-histidine N(alpha)-methyltransferase [[Limnothrix rosea] IAM M-220]|uniref:L-histidine N(alpha)-methyltransferase n=1 Tax=[Limnothrix rosea] IAM M-220 TaxID=454133 RepID=UPI000967A414|nr:L-histidine N(alpha)-methyltransferase [[Limnothrix rosea] IAM M-220]OKH18009.1 dimethylhistidine N-methyltransferase [[Limnothrix rosea] IAM M-220]
MTASTTQAGQLKLVYLLEKEDLEETGKQLLQGLRETPKTISPRYFYDVKGSALFEQICELPEYYPTRTEAEILKTVSSEIAAITGNAELVELGSGSSTKTRFLLDAYQQFEQLDYVPVDVSASIVEFAAERLFQEYETLSITGLIGTYEQAIAHLPDAGDLPRMLIFLGSTLGNFSAADSDRFFKQTRQSLRTGDYFLLGLDRHKSSDILEAAYNDSQGITAAFNLNMLEHLNDRYGANFETRNFRHRAIYNVPKRQIEMHLDCLATHTVTFPSLDTTIEFQGGESILTEISRKFELEQLQDNLAMQGLKTVKVWGDRRDWFSLILTQVV